MNLVEQRYTGDCGVAALAMFTGKTYDEISALVWQEFNLSPPVDGLCNFQMAWILKKLGYQPMENKVLIFGLPCIISVASGRSKYHFIVSDGKEILDPSQENPFTMKEVVQRFPISEIILCKKDLGWDTYLNKHFSKIKIPEYYYREYDFNYIKKHYVSNHLQA